MLADVRALNIHRHVEVNLNELAKLILIVLMRVLYNALIWERFLPTYT